MSDDNACPFCGCDDPQIEETDVRVFALVCQECGAIGPRVSAKNDDDTHTAQLLAVGAWNERAARERAKG